MFINDEMGAPIALKYRAGTYAAGTFDYFFFEKNYKGDVVAVYNANGVKIGTYNYDAWGACTVTRSSGITATEYNVLSTYNPFRYRGYYYDVETELYYLNTRYYNPSIGRFLNADGLSNLGAIDSVFSYNLFAYCLNNPGNFVDESGMLPSWATKLIVGTAVIAAAAVLVAATGGAAAGPIGCFAVGALKGAVVGAAMGAATGAVSGAVEHRLTTGSWEGAGEAALEGAADGYMSGAISGFISGGMGSNQCFVAGTLVATQNGLVPIEDIEVGDLVWATDEETGETELKEVVQLFRNETEEWVHVTVNGEKITFTSEHPFYSPVKGWTSAIDLRAGDILVMLNGEYVVVEQVQHELLEGPETTYNFEVEDYHTYYVGVESVLVHNLCNGVGSKGWENDATWRQNVKKVGNGGNITSLNGGIPTQAQAEKLIKQSGGKLLRAEFAHKIPNPHTYTHINYLTSNGKKGTLRVLEEGFKALQYVTH